MSTSIRASRLMRRLLALPVVLCASAAALTAQTSPATPANENSAPAASNYNLQVPAQLDLPAFSSSSSSAPSADQTLVASVTDHLNLPNAQYGRRRYGSPRYRGSNTNEDGSEKYVFFAGAGFGQPLGNTYHYLNPNYGFQVGVGRNFNKSFGTMLQFDYDKFGFNKRTISNQAYIYSGDANAADNAIDGSTHVWSFTIDPTYTFKSSEGLGGYLVVGAGFYHKVADFTAPQEEEYFDPYYGYVAVDVQSNIDHYTSNSFGANGGFGLTYKFSRFSNERLYGEVRYVFVDNQQRRGFTVANLNQATVTSTNFYPANSNRTTYIPVKFGIRF